MERPNDKGRAAMEQMSTADLEELLRQDFHAPEGGKTDMGRLYHAAQVLAQRAAKPQAETDRAWERFRKKYLPLADVRSARYEDGATPSLDAAGKRRHSPLRRWGWRAMVAAAVAAALVLSVSAAAASGFELLKRLVQWTDEQVWLAPGQVVPVDDGHIRIPEEPREYAGLQEALTDCGLVRPVAPRRLPEGFALEELVVDPRSDCELIFNALYTRGEDTLVVFVCIYLDYEGWTDGNFTNFQKDEGDPVLYEAGDITHMLFTNAGRASAVWADGPAECAVSGDVTMEELRQMIDSIYE